MTTQSAQSLYELVGAPLMALVDAESQAAKATANYIKEMGFKEEAGSTPSADRDELGREIDFGALRMVSFRSQKRMADGTHRTFKVEVPLLSLLPIPALQIKDAELEFFARIVDIKERSRQALESSTEKEQKQGVEGEESKDEKAQKYSPLHMPSRDIKATFGTSAAENRGAQRQKLDMQIKIKIRMEQADIPAGLGSLFNLMQQNITSTEVTDHATKQTPDE